MHNLKVFEWLSDGYIYNMLHSRCCQRSDVDRKFNMQDKTSIKISSLTKKRLAGHGYFNESYDVVISRLIDEVEVNRKYNKEE
jgi:hypothetical protein